MHKRRRLLKNTQREKTRASTQSRYNYVVLPDYASDFRSDAWNWLRLLKRKTNTFYVGKTVADIERMKRRENRWK